MAFLIELCGCCRTNKPQSGLFRRHYYTSSGTMPQAAAGLPALPGILIAGILLGLCGLDLLDLSVLNISADLRQLALIIILTRAGLSLDLRNLKRVGRPTVLMCFVPACLEIGGTVLIAPRLRPGLADLLRC